MSDVCLMRTGYYQIHPEHREIHGVPDGPLGHSDRSRMRVGGGEWVTHCSWCGRSISDDRTGANP